MTLILDQYLCATCGKFTSPGIFRGFRSSPRATDKPWQ